MNIQRQKSRFQEKGGNKAVDYTNLRNTIRGMQDEIIGGIQDCIRIDSVGGEPEEGAPYGPGPKKALEYGCIWGKLLDFARQMWIIKRAI